MGFKNAGFPKFGFNPIGFKQSIGGFASLVKDAGGVLYLDARKANGSGPLAGNDSPFVDLANKIGKNLVGSIEQGDIGISGQEITSSVYVRPVDYIEVLSSTQYKLSSSKGTANCRVAYYDSDKIFISVESNGVDDLNTPSNCKFVRFRTPSTDLNVDIQLEKGSVATSYEPHTRNDGSLTNFAGTGTSGWQATPNVLRFDGVDDFVAFADTASLDITNAPLAIGVTFKNVVDQVGYILAKNQTDATDVQYGILCRTGRTVEFYKNGSSISQFAYNNDNYTNVVFYWDGINITGYENGLPKNQQANGDALLSSGVLRLGKRQDSGILNGNIATVTIYTSSDINKILKAEAKISAEYLALNP